MNAFLLQALPGTGGLDSFTLIAVAVMLIIATILIIVFVKQVIVNSVLGLIAWGLLIWVFGIQLPFIPSLVVSIVFGLAGIGVMLILRLLGLF